MHGRTISFIAGAKISMKLKIIPFYYAVPSNTSVKEEKEKRTKFILNRYKVYSTVLCCIYVFVPGVFS